MAFIKRRYLFEADDDNGGNNANGADQNTAQNNTQQNAQGSDDAQENNAQNDTSNDDSNNDDQNQDTDNQDDQNADENNEEDDDYSVDAEPDEDEDNSDDSGDDNSDDSGDDNNDSEESEEDSEEKQMDRDMFSTLSEDEQKRKIATLKRLFIDLYSNADSLIEKFGLIDTGDEDENFLSVIKRIINILYDMKEYVNYYVLNIFDKSSYIENDITFNRYLSVLNSIKLITDELEKQKEIDDKSKK